MTDEANIQLVKKMNEQSFVGQGMQQKIIMLSNIQPLSEGQILYVFSHLLFQGFMEMHKTIYVHMT